LFIAKCFLALTGGSFTELSDCLVGAGGINKRFVGTFRFVCCNARESNTFHLILPGRSVVFVFQVPNKNVGVYSR